MTPAYLRMLARLLREQASVAAARTLRGIVIDTWPGTVVEIVRLTIEPEGTD